MSFRDEILRLLWWTVPCGDDAEAKATAARMLDSYRAEVIREVEATVARLRAELEAVPDRRRMSQLLAAAMADLSVSPEWEVLRSPARRQRLAGVLAEAALLKRDEDEVTHVVTDASDVPEHADDCPGCVADPIDEWLGDEPMSTDLNAAREKARAMFTALDGAVPRWRVVDGGGESLTGIAPVCPEQANGPLHALPDGGRELDPSGLYDCCPWPWLEVESPVLAEYLVALLNEDAASGGEVR